MAETITPPGIQGNSPSGVADVGSPVKAGGKYNSTLPTFTDGQRGDLQIGSKGALIVAGIQANGSDTFSSTLGFLPSSVGNTLLLGAAGFIYNPLAGQYERPTGNYDATAFASAARTATPTPFDGVNRNGRGLHLVIDCTAITSAPSVVFTIQGKDTLSGKFYTVLASAAIVGTGTTILRVYPGLTAVGNLTVSDVVPRAFRVIATHGNADSITYSVGYSLVL